MEAIAMNVPCVVEKFEKNVQGARGKKTRVRGKFKKTYRSFYLFETEGGFTECFLKHTRGIDWEAYI